MSMSGILSRRFNHRSGGEEIMAQCGLKEGRVVGQIKKAIEDAILDEKIDNTYDDAYKYFITIKKNFCN